MLYQLNCYSSISAWHRLAPVQDSMLYMVKFAQTNLKMGQKIFANNLTEAKNFVSSVFRLVYDNFTIDGRTNLEYITSPHV